MRWGTSAVIIAATLAGLSLVPRGEARADVVDDAFARGNDAAGRGEWAVAVEAYEEARRLLPGQSALLSYNLGTSYAQLGKLGYATYHLTRARWIDAGDADDVADSATRNLGVVRRRAEVAAAGEGRQISPKPGWWAVLVSVLDSGVVATLAVVTGWLMAAAVGLRAWQKRRGGDVAVTSIVALSCGVLTAVLAFGHGSAVGARKAAPPAIVLTNEAEVRGAAGSHRKVEFRLQGGSLVRIVGHSPGWVQIRMPSGLVGWVTDAALGRLDADSDAAPALDGGPGGPKE